MIDGTSMDQEAGANDNRLALSIGDHPEIKEWEDGQRYQFDKVVVEQSSPGEFVVVSAEGGQPADEASKQTPPNEAEAAAAPGEAAPGGEEGEPEYENPAVAGLMRRQKS